MWKFIFLRLEKELISTGSYKAEFQLNQLLESTRDQALVS